MAAATVALTITDTWVDKRSLYVKGTLDFDTGDYAAGGVPLSFAQNPVKSSKLPTLVIIVPRTGAVSGKFVFTYIPGATRDAGKVAIGNSATNAEHAAAQLDALISAEVVDIFAVFPKYV